MLDSTIVTKLLCVAFVAAIMLPVGHILFPYVSDELSGMQFQAIEAVVSATVGFGILFGAWIKRSSSRRRVAPGSVFRQTRDPLLRP
jgi:hypothetical protein